MAVLHDWVCVAHGKFESSTGKCPSGCGDALVSKVFLKAPGHVTGRTQNIDKTIRGIAEERGVTNLNNRGGQAAFQYDKSMDAAADSMRAQYLSGQTFASGIGSGDNAIQGTLAENNFKGDNALAQVKDLISGQPKPIVTASWSGKD